MVSTRAEIITRRTYNRPLNEEGTIFETWEQTIERVISHQRWLWERALTHNVLPNMPLHDVTEDMLEWVFLTEEQEDELEELHGIMLSRKALSSGRNLWLGGTDVAKTRESSMFNCSGLIVETIYDVVDVFWLLLQGCGVGAKPKQGTLTGFRKPIKNIEVVRTTRTAKGGRETNEESFVDGVWHLSLGDSAESWGKSIGKILAGKYDAHTLILDFSELRPAGLRLSGYGWISSGDEQIAKAFPTICEIMNKRAGSLLRDLDIIDIINLLGTVLSSRRSAEIILYDYDNENWREFASFKKNCYEPEFAHRQQSNNSLVFNNKPSKEELTEIFDLMIKNGGSEPGFINGQAARKRAPWFSVSNPCIPADINILTNKGIRTVFDLINTDFVALIGNEEYKCTGFFETGTKDIYNISTSKGYSLKATSNHKILTDTGWKQVGELNNGDNLVLDNKEDSFSYLKNEDEYNNGWLVGNIVGDGGYNPKKYAAYARYWGENAEYLANHALSIVKKLPYTKHRPVALSNIQKRNKHNSNSISVTSRAIDDLLAELIEESTKDFKPLILKQSISFIAGLISGFFDADGSVQGNLQKGVSIRLAQSNLSKLDIVQKLLSIFGIVSTIYKDRQAAGMRKLPDSNRELKDYYCKASHELVISKNNMDLFFDHIGLFDPDKNSRWNDILNNRKRKPYKTKYVTEVTSVEYIGKEKVYDCTIPGIHRYVANSIIVHNCNEVLLSNKSFCNLVEIDVSKFIGDSAGLHRVADLISRANYRQTVVDFRDGMLQEAWHLNNEFLRLCGVGITGITQRADMTEYDWKDLRYTIVTSARGMANELNLPKPKNVTVVKPSGTLSKIMDTTEGIHKPLSKYIFNWVNFSKHDPVIDKLKNANYNWIKHPTDTTSILVCFPVAYGHIDFDEVEVTRKDGTKETLEINTDSAISQLEEYKKLQTYYCDQNVSNTISYSPDEKEEIVDWLLENWSIYVGVSFLFRNDPTLCAKDLGFNYLPQECVSKAKYDKYINTLSKIDLDAVEYFEDFEDEGCSGGSCPII